MDGVQDRWLRMFKGDESVSRAGYWDTHIVLANRFHWTPSQVNGLTESFTQELMAFIAAEAEYNREEQKKAESERKKADGGKKGESGPPMIPPNLPKRT